MSVLTVQPAPSDDYAVDPPAAAGDDAAEPPGVVAVGSLVATPEQMAGAHGMAWWTAFWALGYGTCLWPLLCACTCTCFPNGLRWLGLCETPMRFAIDRAELVVEREEGCTTLVPKPFCGPRFCLKKRSYAAADVERALVMRQVGASTRARRSSERARPAPLSENAPPDPRGFRASLCRT